MNILIVEDEKFIREEMANLLREQHYTVEQAGCYKDGCEKLDLYDYDCMIVDIMLPDGSGLDLIRFARRREKRLGIVVVSARGTVEEKIEGLECGADDYLAKPFSLAELNARVSAVIRRRCFDGANDFRFNELRIVPDAHQVWVNQTEVVLTRKEYDILIYLVANRGRILSKESIVEHLWGDMMGVSVNSFDFIYTHIRNLRNKLIEAGARDYIHTIYAVGYKFYDPDEVPADKKN